MSTASERLERILEHKAAVRTLKGDRDRIDSTLTYIFALEQQLRFAAGALERAKDLVGKNVTIDKPVASYGRDKAQQPAHEWFDEKIAAARELVDAKPPAPTGEL